MAELRRSQRVSPLRAELTAFFDDGPVRRESSVLTVHFVCEGNVCRSPLAAGLLATALSKTAFSARISSSGLGAAVGSPADAATQRFAISQGVDLRGHLARQFSPEFATAATLVLTATREQRDRVIGLAPAATLRVFSLRSFAALVHDASGALHELIADAGIRRQLRHENDDIADPIGQSDAVHRAVGGQIADAVQTVARVLAG